MVDIHADNNDVYRQGKDRPSEPAAQVAAPPERSPSSAVGEIRQKIGAGSRLQSLDFYRGLIMVLLMLESSGLYRYLARISEGTGLHSSIIFLFEHATWHALHFWDFIQPGFMFIAGTALAFSLYKQSAKGVTWKEQHRHAWRRSGWLFFWGVLDYAVEGDHVTFELWDVLTQLSFTLLVAFFIFRWKTTHQLLFCLGLLLLTEILYRYTHIPGFSEPFTDQRNFGNYVDLLLMNKINPGGWVAINCLPTAVHTILGAIAGKWLLMAPDYKGWMKKATLWALLLLVLGYSLDLTGITPIIKRIATTSFTLVTGGWCLLALVFLFWWIDVRKHIRWVQFFTIVGMNSIFIYLFFEIVVGHWLFDYSQILVGGFLGFLHVPEILGTLLATLTLFAFEWGLCYWLYSKRIFFKV